jgi:hypothetical protein
MNLPNERVLGQNTTWEESHLNGLEMYVEYLVDLLLHQVTAFFST